MALTFLLDEQLRGVLFQAIRHHNAAGGHFIDALRVGDPADLPLGSPDPDVLLWAEREGRILLSFDKSTMPGHFLSHLRAGRHSPGVLMVREGCPLPVLISELELVAHAGDPADYFDQLRYFP